MNRLNATLTALSELVLAPLMSWPPLLVLIIISVVCGVAMTIVFRHTSNQRALRRVADLNKEFTNDLRRNGSVEMGRTRVRTFSQDV